MALDIRKWQDIDAAWLTDALAQGGVTAAVKSFTATPVGTGQIGDCIRFQIDYADGEGDGPASLVGKFPSEGAESRATGVALGNYYREVKFYQQLQARARIATPKVYFTDVEEDSHDFVLIMEDAAPAEQGDQLVGVTIEQAEIVLKEAAKLHAAFWNEDSLDQLHWVMGSSAAPDAAPPEMFGMVWAGFKDRYGDRVSPVAARIGDALTSNMDKSEDIRAGVATLIHSDFRPDNMLFATEKGGAPVLVVDWQSFAYGPPAGDVGYFLAGAISPEMRRANEERLLDIYRQELKTQGIADYPADQLARHYIAGAYQLFVTAFFASMVVTQTERGDDMFFQMINSATDLIQDHDAVDWYE